MEVEEVVLHLGIDDAAHGFQLIPDKLVLWAEENLLYGRGQLHAHARPSTMRVHDAPEN